MKEQSLIEGGEPRPGWEALEASPREGIRRSLQQQLAGEVVGRPRSRLAPGWEAPTGYRNGHGTPRRLRLMAGTVMVRRPRVRGLAHGGCDLALRELLGAAALIWGTPRVGEQRFRRLDRREVLPEVAGGRVVYVDGVREQRGNEKAAA